MTPPPDFKYLSPEFYRHPAETAARARLTKIPGFAKVLDLIADSASARAERSARLAGMVRAGPGVYPLLAELWNTVQNRFGLNGVPLHIGEGLAAPCAVRGGGDAPALALDAGQLALPEGEMDALLSMQAGLIRLGNADYLAAADCLRRVLDAYGVAGAAAALPAWGLENWRRSAMFSADRAAALSQGNPDGVADYLARTAGAGETGWGGVARPDDLRLQGLEAQSHEQSGAGGAIRRYALAMNRQNSAALVRRLDLLDWFAGGAPAKILAGEITRPDDSAGASAQDAAADPGPAYWGEFASWEPELELEKEKESCFFGSCPLGGVAGTAEKGVQSFIRAGGAFWQALRDRK